MQFDLFNQHHLLKLKNILLSKLFKTGYCSILLSLLLTSCAGMGQDQTIGTLAGGGAGALIGSQFGQGNGRTAAMLGGAAVGGLLGNSVGLSMDKTNAN